MDVPARERCLLRDRGDTVIASSMLTLLPIFALFGVGTPAVCAVYAGVRWAVDRRAHTLAFRPTGRERRLRPNTWRQ